MIGYLKNAFGEFKNIIWLSTRRVLYLTILVLVFSLIIGFFLGAVDNLFAEFIKTLF